METATRYLAAAGVRRFRAIARQGEREPDWRTGLTGASVVLTSTFEAEGMLRWAVALGVPAVLMRSHPRVVDLVAFRRHGPCPHLDAGTVTRSPLSGGAAVPAHRDGVSAVIGGTLAACEILWILARPGAGPRARHLRVPMTSDRNEDPLMQEIPWSPECFACGGTAPEPTSTGPTGMRRQDSEE
jgi:hypothetical protein